MRIRQHRELFLWIPACLRHRRGEGVLIDVLAILRRAIQFRGGDPVAAASEIFGLGSSSSAGLVDLLRRWEYQGQETGWTSPIPAAESKTLNDGD
jgi:hypothetical protein